VDAVVLSMFPTSYAHVSDARRTDPDPAHPSLQWMAGNHIRFYRFSAGAGSVRRGRSRPLSCCSTGAASRPPT
jgi:hypothetical protein